jgi:hypothetical protein
MLCLLVSFTFPSQTPPDSIRWGTREIVWADFKGKLNPRGLPMGAETMSVLHIEISESAPQHPQVLVEALFNPSRSWVQTKSQDLLSHEKGHFAISELYARKLRHYLSNHSLKSATYEDQTIALFQQMNRAMDDYQVQYDKETDFSRNAEQQKKWEQSLTLQLQQLAAFTEVVVQLRVEK